MKRFLWAAGGLCAAAAGLLVWGSKRTPKVEDLAQQLEDAWADRHSTL
jgi:hypothetical protein